MRKLIRVSNPPSGIAIQTNDEFIEALGGIGNRVRVSKIVPDGGGGYQLFFVKDREGRTHVDNRMTVTHQRLAMIGCDMPDFGPEHMKWEPTGNGATIFIPPVDTLPPPLPRPRAPGYKHMHGLKACDHTTPHARLGEAIRTINQICASGEVSDVTFAVPFNDNGGTYAASDFRVTAKRVIEEVLS
jgi:hypothetical protein